MILLTATTDKISLITSATCDLDVVASYVDRDKTSFAVEAADRQLTNITTATTTDIVAAPASTEARNVKHINIRNVAATSVDVTIQFNANGTLYELFKRTLLTQEVLTYVDAVQGAWFHITRTALLNRSMRCPTNSVHATAGTWADITGMTCPLLSGKFYNVLAYLFHNNDASTTGSRFGYNIGAAPTTAIFGTIDTVTPSVTASVHSAGVITARDTAITAQTTGSTTERLAIIAGMIQPSADGTFAMRATSEVTVANGLTVQEGSFMRIWEPTG